MMQRRKRTVLTLISCFALGSVQITAHGGVITTQQYLNVIERQQTIERIDALLAREEVRSQLERLGVDPADALARVDALTDSELTLLAAQIEELPAGASLLGVIGVVFVVLLILELVGVIDIFKRI
jgi:uncharacterized membrane protein (Fun14 family)